MATVARRVTARGVHTEAKLQQMGIELPTPKAPLGKKAGYLWQIDNHRPETKRLIMSGHTRPEKLFALELARQQERCSCLDLSVRGFCDVLI